MKNSILILTLVLINTVFAQAPEGELRAKIIVEEIENNIKITGTAENLSDIMQSMTYKLSVIKKNSNTNNQSNNAQEGLFSLEPNEIKNLSTTQVNIGKNDQIIVMLLFYNEDKEIVAKDRIVLGEAEKKKEIILLPEDGFMLSGIVSDDTKTKIGKDFYDMYYYMYNDKKVNSKKIVTVSEELSFARTTKLIITVENNIVLEFIAKPDEEFLKYMAQESINATINQLKKLEKQSKQITQY
ncbi:CsgE family curli-type amyloid fiber assembly protein [Flavobacterium ichthyis]|nr:CsgE family curli-type amyloid fiber assembly protein [Flavobacterium ichthyis]